MNIGQTVVASLNAPSLFLIAKDLTKMQIWTAVNEADVAQISPDARGRLQEDPPGEAPNISLKIHAGELVALAGASGSGKSTLMNILGCLDHPTSGNYWLAGQDVCSLSAERRAAARRWPSPPF